MAIFLPVSLVTEEFYNNFHGKGGLFATGPGAHTSRFKSGPGKGLFSLPKTSKRGPKHALLGFKPHARQSYMSESVEEFYNKYHSKKDGKFVSGGHAVTGPALPLRNAVTGRINPTQVRAAFKTGATTRKPRESAANMNRRTAVGEKPATVRTYKGRVIRQDHGQKSGPARYTSMGPAVRKFVGEHTGPARRAKDAAKAREQISQALAAAWYKGRVAEKNR